MNDYRINVNQHYAPMPGLPSPYPLFTITLESVPSWNRLIGENNPIERSKITKKQRLLGYAIGLEVGRALGIKIKTVAVPRVRNMRDAFRDALERMPFNFPLFCGVRIWRERSIKDKDKAARKRDIYNPDIKGLIDGLTDAGLWEDDNESLHRAVMYAYMGLDTAPRTEISFYRI